MTKDSKKRWPMALDSINRTPISLPERLPKYLLDSISPNDMSASVFKQRPYAIGLRCDKWLIGFDGLGGYGVRREKYKLKDIKIF